MAWKVIKNKSARDIDLSFLILRTLATALYVAYGYIIDDIYVTISNIVPLICSVIILIVKAKYHNRVKDWHIAVDIVKKCRDKHGLNNQSDGWCELKDIITSL